MAKVVVGVPIYNEEKYIEHTLRSLIRQDYDNVSFIVSDNASTDSSWDLCQDLVGHDPRFTLKRNEKNNGALTNFEQVFRNSVSEYFMWLGGHDFISAGYIKKAATLLDEHPMYSMACGMPTAVKEGQPNRLLDSSIYKFTAKRLGRYLQSVREVHDCTIVHSLFRRTAMDGFSFRATTGPDMVIIGRLLWHGQLGFIPEEQYFRRYFDAKPESYEERIAGQSCRLSYYDLLRYYLDDFSLLYTGDVRMKNYIENEIVAILSKKYGIQCLLPDDDM
jgi:glycosyltransferase involved in cell wall biosynthesis